MKREERDNGTGEGAAKVRRRQAPKVGGAEITPQSGPRWSEERATIGISPREM